MSSRQLKMWLETKKKERKEDKGRREKRVRLVVQE